MRAVTNSLLAFLLLGTLVWGNCFCCPQLPLSLASHAPAHGCCEHPGKQPVPSQLIQKFNVMVCEAEKLLNSIPNSSGDKPNSLYAKVEQIQTAYEDLLHDVQQTARNKSKAAARATDDYVHHRPWQAIGIAASLGVVAGMTTGLFSNRRKVIE